MPLVFASVELWIGQEAYSQDKERGGKSSAQQDAKLVRPKAYSEAPAPGGCAQVDINGRRYDVVKQVPAPWRDDAELWSPASSIQDHQGRRECQRFPRVCADLPSTMVPADWWRQGVTSAFQLGAGIQDTRRGRDPLSAGWLIRQLH